MTTRDSIQWSGFLFVLEGIDGAGKTTVCDSIEENLRKDGIDVVRLREPTSESKWGKEIRRRSPNGELTPREELELFIKDREWHVKNKILPALQEGKTVLMDRYFFATGAYQYTSTGIPWSEILERNRKEIHAPEPTIVFILDIPAKEGLERVLGSRGKLNEQFEQIDRLVKVREAYLAMSEEDTGNFKVIDATRPIDSIVDEVYAEIQRAIADADTIE
ncbi:MAG: dTMP kinase [Candidatus Thorarchaeota archaeon]